MTASFSRDITAEGATRPHQGSGSANTRHAPADIDDANRRLATPQRLREFFSPRSLAMVGASDTSGWARYLLASLKTAGFEGRVVPVHPRHETVFDLPAVPSLRHLDEPVDLAFVLVPTHAVEAVADDAGAAGVRNLVVLAADYAEAGAGGRKREGRLIVRAAGYGITVLGPNCLGFVNAPAKAAPYGLAMHPPLLSGPVGIVLQSGALASAVLGFARARAIGVSLLPSMGNEGMITTPDVIDYLIEDEGTKVIALFCEGIPAASAVRRARPQGVARGQADRCPQGGAQRRRAACRPGAHRRGGRRRRGRRRGAAPVARDPGTATGSRRWTCWSRPRPGHRDGDRAPERRFRWNWSSARSRSSCGVRSGTSAPTRRPARRSGG